MKMPCMQCGGFAEGYEHDCAANMARERVGHWMQTISGRRFYPLDPRPSEIFIEDIAYALSNVCRFGGHCSRFYCVADHSIRVSRAVAENGGTTDEILCGLLHDAAEAYIGDMVWPLKQAPEMKAYKTIEHGIEAAIAVRFGVPFPNPAIVKKCDLILLSTEKRDLMGHEGAEIGRQLSALETDAAKNALDEKWHSDGFAPLPRTIQPRDPGAAQSDFLIAFRGLTLARERDRRRGG